MARRTCRTKATLAVARSILTIVYVLLRAGGTYRDNIARAADVIVIVTVTDQRIA